MHIKQIQEIEIAYHTDLIIAGESIDVNGAHVRDSKDTNHCTLLIEGIQPGTRTRHVDTDVNAHEE